MNDALRDWVTNVRDTFYCIGTVAGPHPYPAMVRDFQSIIGKETKEQMHGGRGPSARHDHRRHRRRLERDGPVLSVPRRQGGGIIGVEAGGKGVNEKMEHCASLTGGRPGVLHGNRTYLLQDDDGQILEGISISAGLDYPGIGPEHAGCTTSGARNMSRSPMPRRWRRSSCAARPRASSRAGAQPRAGPCDEDRARPAADHLICMNMCGRGDKDIFTVARALGRILYRW
jgi:tryptophan synthase beta chain